MPLTKEDLKSIGQVIREQVPPPVESVITERIPPLVESVIQARVPGLVEKVITARVPLLIEAVTGPSFLAIKEDLNRIEGTLDRLTTTVDQFAHIVRRHEEEWLVLRAQHAKMHDLLVKKGIATEDELAVA